MALTVGSIFSGVGGFDMGFEAAGFRVAWQIEVDRDCTSVLERHWPDVPRHGDVRSVDPSSLAPVDVVVFGSPCQDFSVAGKRAGLAGERSGLFGEATRIIAGLRPRPAVCVWENVPGALSSAGGRDFGAALDALADLGALDIAWRVLDARHWGVPQRRRRVFVVGDLGGERAASILFEPEGGGGHPATSGAAGQGAAGGAADGAGVAGFDARNGVSTGDIGIAVQAGAGSGRGVSYNCLPLVSQAVAAADGAGVVGEPVGVIPVMAAGAHGANGAGIGAAGSPMFALDTTGAHAVAFGGNRTSVPIDVTTACNAHGGPHGRLDLESETFVVANRVTASAGHHGHSSPRGDGSDNLVVAAPLTAGSHPNSNMPGRHREDDENLVPVAFMANASNRIAEECVADASPPLGATDDPVAVAFNWQAGGGGNDTSFRGKSRQYIERAGDYAGALSTTRHDAVAAGMAVRRLTPRECEKLQGWPPDHTRYRADGSEISDGPRYRMVGNGVVAPVAAWIAARIAEAL